MAAVDVRQLWSLACLLAQKQLTAQAAQCLEPLCAIDCSTRSGEEQIFLVQANILLAEICSYTCSNSKKAIDQDLWTRRVIQTEKCIISADAAIARGIPCSHENKLRLLKAKFLLQQQLKAERAAKNRRLLEILCEGLKSCAKADDPDAEEVAAFRSYFGVKLKACLLKMHAATVMTKYAKNSGRANTFADNLKYLRETLANYVDKSFMLWLVEVTCQTAIFSFQPGSTAEMKHFVDFGQEFFDEVAPVSPEFRTHHLIITGFYYLRTGKLTKVAEQINLLVQGTGVDGDQHPAGTLKEGYLNTMLDAMRVSVVAGSDPEEALHLAMSTVLAAQTNLETYAQHPAVRLMLIATLFDLLHIYCRLLGLQCRYADMGASLVQMTTLFAEHKADLERTIFYRFFLARCHTLIAKYATAIGKVKDACAHLKYVVDKVLPALSGNEEAYPDAYLAVWVDVLEVATYCCGLAATQPGSARSGSPVEQIYPSRVLLEWAGRIFASEGLRRHFYQCCSAELRAKYDLALAKWMWATEMLSKGATGDRNGAAIARRFTQHATLEELRPKAFSFLHEALQRMNTSVACCETTAEILVLFGPQLVAFGKVQEGENMLTRAIHSSVHSKNVLLQVRVLADVVELHMNKGLVEAQAAAASKYEKMVALLRRRIAAAQAEVPTTSALLRWTAGSNASTPSDG